MPRTSPRSCEPPLADPRVLVLTGLTCSGKSDLAVRVAETVGAVIVNADSRQLYRDLDVGTAKPDPAQLARAEHRGYDRAGIGDTWSLGRFLAETRADLAHVRVTGRPVIVVGGPGLYLNGLVQGMEPPAAPDAAADRIALEVQAAADIRVLRDDLLRRDPAAGDSVDLANPRRVVRALEIVRASGRPFAESARRRQPTGWPIVVLSRPWTDLERRISTRSAAIFAGGIINETRAALDAGHPRTAPGLSAIGYPQALRVVLDGGSLETAIDETAVATRRLARRQTNWLRRLSTSAAADDAIVSRIETVDWNESDAVTVSRLIELVS